MFAHLSYGVVVDHRASIKSLINSYKKKPKKKNQQVHARTTAPAPAVLVSELMMSGLQSAGSWWWRLGGVINSSSAQIIKSHSLALYFILHFILYTFVATRLSTHTQDYHKDKIDYSRATAVAGTRVQFAYHFPLRVALIGRHTRPLHFNFVRRTLRYRTRTLFRRSWRVLCKARETLPPQQLHYDETVTEVARHPPARTVL